MPFTSAAFPDELIHSVFTNVKGHSSIAKLVGQTPVPFSGTDIMVFTMDGEVNLVGEGEAKGAHTGGAAPVSIVPRKVEYGQRVSDEFVRCSEERQLDYLTAFSDGFSRKIARGLDIMALHGINPKTGTAATNLIGTNSFDTNTGVHAITYVPATPDPEGNITAGVAAIGDYDLNGLILSKNFTAALADITVNGVRQYPELMWGGNPGAIKGVPADVNTTVSKVTGKYAYGGDFAALFKWGYSNVVNFEVIQYGDPDGGGDLKRKNQVYLRAEAWIGWAILDPAGFFRVET